MSAPLHNYRNSDPETSKEAFQAVEAKIGTLHVRILQALQRAGSSTASEMMEHCDLLYNTAWRRLSELKHMGMVQNTEGRRRNPRNRNEVVVTMTAAGHEYLKTAILVD